MPRRIEKLQRDHKVDGFDCGKEPLNRFLINFALQSQLSNSSQTYLALSDDDVIGYYTLVFGDLAYDDAPERLRKGIARHPIPLMILARLAVSRQWAGKHVGAGLLERRDGAHPGRGRHRGSARLRRPRQGRRRACLLWTIRFHSIAQRSFASLRSTKGRPPFFTIIGNAEMSFQEYRTNQSRTRPCPGTRSK